MEEKVQCIECGKEHDVIKVEDYQTPEYYTVIGNVLVNGKGGILGNGDWDKYGTPDNVFCLTCVNKLFKYHKYVTPDRKHSLITQVPSDVPMLTVEDYTKWDDLFLLQVDGTVTPVRNILNVNIQGEKVRTWYDHCPTPAYFHAVAKYLGARYDDETFNAVCTRFVRGVLGGDWTKLSNYMPKETNHESASRILSDEWVSN